MFLWKTWEPGIPVTERVGWKGRVYTSRNNFCLWASILQNQLILWNQFYVLTGVPINQNLLYFLVLNLYLSTGNWMSGVSLTSGLPALHSYRYIPSWKFPERLLFSLSEHSGRYFGGRICLSRFCPCNIWRTQISGLEDTTPFQQHLIKQQGSTSIYVSVWADIDFLTMLSPCTPQWSTTIRR